MAAGTVTVFGATGKTGRAVTVASRRAGLQVRGASRDAERARGRLDGVTWHQADIVTGDGLAEALTGADAAYLIVPNVHPAEVDAVARAATVASEVGVSRIVYHSVADPDDQRMAHHVRKGEAERALRTIRPDAVVLRPCAYHQNLLPAAMDGRIEVPYRLDAPFSLVDLDDVAEVAAGALAGDVEAGSTHVLAGPEELTVTDLAEQAGEVLGRPVTAAQITVDDWRSGPGAGVAGSALEDLLAMFAAYDESGFVADPQPLTHLLGRPGTTWAELLTKEKV